MKPFAIIFPFWTICFHLLITSNPPWKASSFSSSCALGNNNESDHLGLLKFRQSISIDPYGILASWNDSIHFCNWHGITCKDINGHQRVTKLRLEGYDLHGLISPYISNLTFLGSIILWNNSFYGQIPQELGGLSHLQTLYLTNNSLIGEIPINLTSCYQLRHLCIDGNNLMGRIPMEIGSLQKLEELYFSANNLTGKIPTSMWNLSSLKVISLAFNNLEGNLPQEVGGLKHLKVLVVAANKLFGTLPSSLYNLSSLTDIEASFNHFNGSIPPNIFQTLPNLQVLRIASNQISGPFPSFLSNASVLRILDISGNHFVGQFQILGRKPENLSELDVLDIGYNNFGGPLSHFIGNLSTKLTQLFLGGNQIFGKLPTTIGNLVNLIVLGLEDNHFIGIIPSSFGKFQKMQALYLYRNKFSGKIPTCIGNLNQLYTLDLAMNLFEGEIPSSIGNCQNLNILYLSENNLSGPIPLGVFSLFSLVFLNLSHNSLSGILPVEVGKLKNIDHLDLSKNRLSGDIPETIGDCMSLEYIILRGNSFHGIIPSTFASLKGLLYLDLSENNLSGSIPEALQSIPVLEYLNVSFNMLDGMVPHKGIFGQASSISILGNSELCGGISKLKLPPCPIKVTKRKKHHSLMGIIVEFEEVVAIKIFNLQKKGAHKSFMSECNALKNIRHRNLVKILTCCSSINDEGHDFKALVFEYMSNGSLEKWLHPAIGNTEHQTNYLLHQRLDIIVDVASALHYLHYECEQPVIHCDLKPSNVLLDENMVARLTDFGLARLLSKCSFSREQSSTIGIKGTIGYTPPEYGMGSNASIEGDVYSFGILVLEMLTRRRPTEEMFKDGHNLHNYVKASFPNKLLQIVDEAIFPRGSNQTMESTEDGYLENMTINNPNIEKWLISLFRIGLACSVDSPKERMNMIDVRRELNSLKSSFLLWWN
ncbi:putative LRR receptor-like serine/threonine-protein kinase [Senna tora]|uniref:non-specific serine/threonine protein kinase n=1 Tax=Senna tora TaxID=362788 RepID=A0A835C9X4_9FABA|nr:putative LRR receptor-like serine/threonine-protein kinase [Senna tora]